MNISEQLFEKAERLIPGGVNSPVRAFNGVGGKPVFFQKGKGAYLRDVDGQNYIDYVGSWGPLILGHCHPVVVSAVIKELENGMSFGAPTELELRLAEKIIALMPSIEKVRMVNSGTEATMTAVRLARGATGKNKIIKFNGCYHGHSDGLLVKAGSGLLTLGIPSTPGIPASVTEHTLTADFNDIGQVEALFANYKDDIAGIILEPVPGNMGLIAPNVEFLQGLRTLCNDHNALLIFDEVMCGFRVALSGAQSLYGVRPDLTTLGKVIGGGMPVGALGGRAVIMAFLAPEGPVYQAGTLSGNPLAMAAGIATLDLISSEGFYKKLQKTAQNLVSALEACASAHQVPFKGCAIGSMFGIYFTKLNNISNYADVAQGNLAQFQQFFHGMLKQGIYFAPSMFEAGFISSAHGDEEIRLTQEAAEKVFSNIKKTCLS